MPPPSIRRLIAFIERSNHAACPSASVAMSQAARALRLDDDLVRHHRARRRAQGDRGTHGDAFSLRQINTTGKSPESLSIPSRKNKPLNPSGKSVI
jgi:hypothetical protein